VEIKSSNSLPQTAYIIECSALNEKFKEVLEAMPVNGKIPLEHYLYEKFGKEAGRNVARIVYCFDTAREAFK